MDSPKISIAMATFNGESFLREQLSSLVNQTLAPDELVVCDDCSSDSTLIILEEFRASISFDLNIKINEINRGAGYSFKNAIDFCTGDIILFCDQDDIWMQDKIENIERLFKETPDLDYVICNANIVNDKSEYLGYSLWDQREFSDYWRKRFNSGYQFEVLQKKNIVTGMTTAISKRVKELGCNKPSFVLHDAWYIYVASINDLKGKLIDKSLVNYRQHSKQQYGSIKDKYNVRILNALKGNQKSVELNIKIIEPLVKYAAQIFNENTDNQKLIYLKDKLDHYKLRKGIVESNGFRRFYFVFQEILNGRYYKHSSVKNALIDLI